MTVNVIAQKIREIYGTNVVYVGYDPEVEELWPVSQSWLVRLWLAFWGKPTHDLQRMPGVCRFVILRDGCPRPEYERQVWLAVEENRPMGVRVVLDYVDMV